MPYHYIVTVGTSLMEVPCFQLKNNPLWERLLGEDKRLSLSERERVRAKMEQLLNECGDDPDSFIIRYPFKNILWERNKYYFLGAELATLRKVHITKQLISPGDSIDLFATRKESASGLCGALLKNILAAIFPECSITLDYTESLDINQPTTFSDGLKEIRTKVHRKLAETAADTPVWLILSGGYKIVAMMLAQLQTKPEFSKKVTVTALHEDSSEGILLLPQLDMDAGAEAQAEGGKTLSIPEPDIDDF